MRKRGPQRHMALLLAAVLLLPLFAVPSSGLAETPYALFTHISITNADNPAAPITRESPVSFAFNLQLGDAPAQHWEKLKNEVFYLYLQRGLFAGAEQIDIVNPACGAGVDTPYAGERVFAADSLMREAGRDAIFNGLDYACYSIQLNTSANAHTYYATEAPALVAFSFTKLLGQGIAAAQAQRVALMTDSGGNTLGEGFLTITETAAEQPTLPQAGIAISMRSRYVWDPAFLQDAVGGEAGAYVSSLELGYCTPGDLCVFEMEIANPHAEPLTLLSLTAHLQEGWRLPAWATPKQVSRGGAPESAAGNAALLPAGAQEATLLPTEAVQVARHTFDTPAILQPGASITLFFVAEAQGSGSLLHTVSVQQENGMQPVGSYEPVRSGQHDLALTVKIEEVYNALNEPVASYPETRPVPTGGAARLGIRFRAENQGEPVGGVSIVAYVPPGFAVLDAAEAFPGGSNAGWELTEKIPMDTANGVWTDLSVYRYTFAPGQPLQTLEACEAMLYVAVQGAIGEQKPGGYPEDVYLPTEYYIAGEIAGFTDMGGKPGVDADSIPDSNPANDLFDNRTGITRYHPINLYQKAQEGAYFGEVKETPGSTAGRAKLRYGLLQDEDDFDFDYAAPARGGVPQQAYGAYVSTRRLPAQETYETALQYFGEWAMAYISGPAELGALALSPVEDGGVLRTTRSYMLYEFWVNRDGMADTAGSHLEIRLPEGMIAPAYMQGEAAQDLIRVYKYQALQRAPSSSDPSLQIIRYDPGFVVEREMRFAGGAGRLHNVALQTDAAGPQQDDAGIYGITGLISEDRRSITLEFGTPSGGAQAQRDTAAAYRILLLAAVDQAHIQYAPMQAQASYQYRGMAFTSAEETPLTWGDSTAPFLLLDAWDAQAGGFAQSPVFAVAVPDSAGQLSVRYRLRFRSEFALAAGSLYLENTIPEQQFQAFSNVQTGGRQAARPDEEGVPLGGQLSVLARADTRKNTLHIRNPWPTGDGQYYDVSYDVQYKNIRYGQLLQNAVGGATALVATPLLLRAAALDGRTGGQLEGCAFVLYYAGEDGGADLTRPVRGVTGLPVQFSSASDAALFLPEGYAPGRESSWQLVLVQAAAPAGFEAHTGAALPISVQSDAEGNLSIMPAAGGSAYTIALDALGAANVQVYNTAPSPISIYVADRRNVNRPLSGAGFALTRPDGSVEMLPLTGRNGRTGFVPGVRGPGDYVGEYLLRAVAAPQAYTGEALGSIFIRLDTHGAISLVQADGADAAGAYLNSDYSSLSALFSPLTQPTLLYVNGAQGIPVSGAQFSLQGPDGQTRLLQTDAGGRIALSGAVPGAYLLWQEGAPEGYAAMPAALHFVIEENGTLRLPEQAGYASLAGEGYCLRIVGSPAPAAAAAPAVALPAPTPAPGQTPGQAPAALERFAAAEQPLSGYDLGMAQGLFAYTSGEKPRVTQGMLLLLGCLALAAELLLLYGCVRADKRKKEML